MERRFVKEDVGGSGLSEEDVAKALGEIRKYGFGSIEVVVVNGTIKTIRATKTIVSKEKR